MITILILTLLGGKNMQNNVKISGENGVFATEKTNHLYHHKPKTVSAFRSHYTPPLASQKPNLYNV